MDDNAFPVLIVVGIVLVMVLAIVFAVWRGRARTQAWEEFAAQSGLSYERGKFMRRPAISGTYRSHELRMDTFTRSSGESSTTYTQVVLSVSNPGGMQLELAPENVFNKVGRALGMQDIETGDAELDGRYIIKGQPESAVLRVLMQINLRQKLLEAKHFHVKLRDNTLRYERQGVESNPEALKSLFDLLSDLADSLEKQGQSL